MSGRILLVEDNASDEKLALLAFRQCGVPNEIVVARDGAAALDYLFGTGPHAGRDVTVQPAVLLLDLNLPPADGLDVISRVRSEARTQRLPIVVFTASAQDEDVARSYALGANAYVRKPLDFGDFVGVARTLATFWLLLNTAPPAGSGR